MTEPTVRSRSVPMLNLGRNVDAVARLHLDSFLALLLIVAASCNADENLSAAALCVMGYTP